MRHLKKGRKLSRRREHRKAMLANLAASLIKNGRVRTTDAKAKEVRPFVERMVTFAKRGDLHARRIVLSRLRDAIAVKKLFDEIGPRFTDRFGGYTRILKLGYRHGDNSPVSLIEFIGEELTGKSAKKEKSAKKKPRKKPSEALKEETQAEETQAEETQAEETQAEETQAEETQAEETQAEETQAEETQAEETQKIETQAEEQKEEKTEEEIGAASTDETAEMKTGESEEPARRRKGSFLRSRKFVSEADKPSSEADKPSAEEENQEKTE